MTWHFPLMVGTGTASVLRNVPDAVGGGPSSPEAGGTPIAGDTPDDAAVSDARPSADAGTPSEDDDADFDATEFSDLAQDPRVGKLVKRVGKLSRRDARHTPIVQGLRAMGIERPEQLRDLLHAARSYEQLQTAAANNPRMRALIHGDAPPDNAPRARQEPEDLPEDLPFEFDENQFPWDRSDPGTAPLLKHLRTSAQEAHTAKLMNHRLFNVVRAMSRDLAELRSAYRGDRSRNEGETMRRAVDTAAAKIQAPRLQNAFRRAVFGEAARVRASGQRVSQQQIIDAVLQDFIDTGQVTPQTARQVADAQRIAERNRTLPRPAAMVGGTPASPQVDRSRETVRDVSRRLLGKKYIGVGG